jgi:hypothetical protein
MNTSFETTATVSARYASDWQPRPELVAAMRQIATIAEGDETAVITDQEITFENQGHRTTISVAKVDLETVDGFWISERIRICTPLEVFSHYNEEHLAVVNMFATTGAVVRDAEGGDAIVSTLPVFDVDTEALADLYTPMVARAALLHLVGPMAAAHCNSEDVGPATLRLPAWDQPSLWGADDFEYAKDRLRQQGFYCNASPSGLTVEFPWEVGACSAMIGDCTSLLQVRADMPHPLAGNGLYYRLDLPIDFSEEEAMRCAAELNRFETEGVDTPPFFGAWCCNSGSGTLSFVGFWPNLMCQFGTGANIAFWCGSRSRIARQVIGNR